MKLNRSNGIFAKHLTVGFAEKVPIKESFVRNLFAVDEEQHQVAWAGASANIVDKSDKLARNPFRIISMQLELKLFWTENTSAKYDYELWKGRGGKETKIV